MKNCTKCRYAKWRKTKNDRLHPSGEGICNYKYRVPKLPESMYWLGIAPTPNGGYINRHDELQKHCVYYQERIKK